MMTMQWILIFHAVWLIHGNRFGTWNTWTDKSLLKCNKPCDGGVQWVVQTRNCTRSLTTGLKCDGNNRRSQMRSCNLQKCHELGSCCVCKNKTASTCSALCGRGVQWIVQQRTCKRSRTDDGCQGSDAKTYTSSCNTFKCNFGTWNSWQCKAVSRCTVTCGGGIKWVEQDRVCKRTRTGNRCVGNNSNTLKCKGGHGTWNVWEDKASKCRALCGGRVKWIHQNRTCRRSATGDYCSRSSNRSSTAVCNQLTCTDEDHACTDTKELTTETIVEITAGCFLSVIPIVIGFIMYRWKMKHTKNIRNVWKIVKWKKRRHRKSRATC